MIWILHLAVPAFAALLIVGFGNSGLSDVWPTYFFLSAPYWLWFLLSEYLASSRSQVFGGFFGIHVSLIAIAILVFSSESREAANGWLLYWLVFPFLLLIGAFIGGKVSDLA
jgi:hypothetical protein